MYEVTCVDPAFSTTRRLTRNPPAPADFANGKFEFSLRFSQSGLPSAEGGLRTRGYFKRSTANDERRPLITIITAVFNAQKTLAATIESVINQSYDNIEFIIVDGGSTDASVDIMRKYDQYIDYWVSQPDAGIYDAWNRGVKLASGDWLAFLGADDAYLSGAIDGYVDFLANHPSGTLEFVSSKVSLVKDTKVLREVGHAWRWSIFRQYMGVAHVGAMHRRTLFEKYGLFDDSFKICGDYELLLRPRDRLGADFFDEVTVNMEVGGVSDTNVRVFDEAARAKILSGKRSVLLSHLEKHWAKLKWRVRKYLSK